MNLEIETILKTASEDELHLLLDYLEEEKIAEIISEEYFKRFGSKVNNDILRDTISALYENRTMKYAVSDTRDAFSLNDWITFWFGEYNKAAERPDQLQTLKLEHSGIFFEQGKEHLKQLAEFIKSFEANVVSKSAQRSEEIKNDVRFFETAVSENNSQDIQKFIDKYAPYMDISKEKIGTEIVNGTEQPTYIYKVNESIIDKYSLGKNADKSTDLTLFSNKTDKILEAMKEDQIVSARFAYKSLMNTVTNKVTDLTKDVFGQQEALRQEFINLSEEDFVEEEPLIEKEKEVYKKEPELKGVPKKPEEVVAGLKQALEQANLGYTTYVAYIRSLKKDVFTVDEELQKYTQEKTALEKKNNKIEAAAKKEEEISKQLTELAEVITVSKNKLLAINPEYLNIVTKLNTGEPLTEEETQLSSSKEATYVQQLITKIQEDTQVYNSLYTKLSGKSLNIVYAENLRRLETLTGLISETFQARKDTGHSDDLNILHSYERQIKVYEAILNKLK